MIDKKKFQKPKEKDFYFAWLILRRISGPIAFGLRNTPVSPNQITLVSILLGIGSFYFFYNGDVENDLIGILLFQFSFLLDCIDGDLARLRTDRKVKISGVYFDYFRTTLLEPLFPIFLMMGLYNQGYSLLLVIAMIVFSIWRWMPQFSREHVLVRMLAREPSLFDKVVDSSLFQDAPKKFAGDRKKFINMIVQGINLIWGLPIGMMNTITILSVVGILLPLGDNYYRIKLLYLMVLIFIYAIYFIRTSIFEFNSLNRIDTN